VVTNLSSTLLRRSAVSVVLIGSFAWMFSDVIFRDRNFVYRDASQFYYPLLKLVQEQWESGSWPLWNPHENAGMPLLGNPASAVLYPPRVILFQWLPFSYATAFKWYTLLHVLLCAGTAWFLARGFGLSEFASGLAAISYAFGAAVLFQYCNVIFLVGAAWVPLAMLSAHRALNAGDWRWACVHGIVLAMQVFGGDPEAAYVSGGLTAIYLAILDAPFTLAVAIALPVLFVCRRLLHGYQSGGRVVNATGAFAAGISTDDILVGLVACTIIALAIWYWRVGRHRLQEPPGLVWQRRKCLAIAALVAVTVAAVQWIPSWEFGRISNRAAGGVHYEPYAFWIAPWRFAEFIWPNIMGKEFPTLSRWLDMFPVDDKIWEPSLYFGALSAALAICAWGIFRVPRWQRWLSLILVFSLWAATGPAGGIGWYRTAIGRTWQSVGDSSSGVSSEKRAAAEMQTPAGGLYWVMMQLLPGFDTFRYPAKLLTFSTIASAILAGIGLDRLFDNERRCRRVLTGFAIASLVFALLALLARTPIIRLFAASKIAKGSPYYGPLIVTDAWLCIVVAFGVTAVSFSLILLLHRVGHTRLGSLLVPAAALTLVACDVACANKWMIVTSPQSQIDAVPKLVQILRDAQAQADNDEPAVPMRIHRISSWVPPKWMTQSDPGRAEEVYRWEKDTIQPKHGLPFGITYTINEGTLEPYDYWWFFAPFYSNTTPEPQSLVYYPIRGFDMWGARYFVLPHLYVPNDQWRGVHTFRSRSTLIAESDENEDDYQVRRNEGAYPRAWIVHSIQYRPPIVGLARADRMKLMREILYEGLDPLWRETTLDGRVLDPRRVAWIENSDVEQVRAYHDPTADTTNDRCTIISYAPDRVVLEAETARRGVLVLAELLYPGWEVEVDGQPGKIWRANRIMRGVPLTPGKHQLIFRFRPMTVRVGAVITLASVAITLATLATAWLRARRRRPQLGG
jgi:hypothetical protein